MCTHISECRYIQGCELNALKKLANRYLYALIIPNYAKITIEYKKAR